ncbi:hypothetical protein COCON_G00196370 [Conger conger]|uniref:Uncharacterized protein n=1 Tax=Conger conger TaxID=82655 RepID=A0A9Q1D231_CONCO|nr:hypothetical protein COCON_G00196370 [Conger conger]
MCIMPRRLLETHGRNKHLRLNPYCCVRSLPLNTAVSFFCITKSRQVLKEKETISHLGPAVTVPSLFTEESHIRTKSSGNLILNRTAPRCSSAPRHRPHCCQVCGCQGPLP